ncbi:MAG TPA: peptidase C39 family protein [Dongiaceae bacterium]|nr:peptidase C39 family protein [Dongiaceae bacterium]
MAAGKKAAVKPLRARAAAKAARPASAGKRIAYYNQSTGFTCGPSSLMMAMNALNPKIKIARLLELQLWREATTIFMGDGHGGCGALGLALAARRRGFGAEVWMNRGGVFLADRLEKKDGGRDRVAAMRLLQEADLAEAKRQRIPVHRGTADLDTLRKAMAKGAVPIVLVSTTLFHGSDGPHWVVVSAITDDAVEVNDPWISREQGQTARHQTGRSVSLQDFTRMTVYGPKKERATVLIKRGS